jgi:hypothetical protein
MNTHTIRHKDSDRQGIPGYTLDGYFIARERVIKQNPDRWDIQPIKRSYPQGDAENQLELEV